MSDEVDFKNVKVGMEQIEEIAATVSKGKLSEVEQILVDEKVKETEGKEQEQEEEK